MKTKWLRHKFTLLTRMAIPLIAFCDLCSAVADDFTVNSTPCKGFVMQDKKWVPVTEIPFMSGERIQTRPVTGRADVVYWAHDGENYSVPKKCLAGVPAGAATAASSKGVSTGKGKSRSTLWFLSASAISWKEAQTLTISSNAHAVNASLIGACLGGGMIREVASSFDFTTDACAVIASANLGAESSDDIDNFTITGATSLGLKLEPGFFWHTSSRLFSVGFAIPLGYRYGNWPSEVTSSNNGTPGTLSGTSSLIYGAALESRLQTGRLLFIPKAGFFGKLSNFAWEFGIGYTL